MMNDGMLSQEEIDALLNSSDDDETETMTQNEDTQDVNEILNEIESDALGEIGNISFGSSATTLATILNQKVDITTPTISVIKRTDLENEFPHPHVGVKVEYTEGLRGINLFVLKSSDAAIIADLMLGGDGKVDSTELNDIHMSAVQEAMNQMMGTAATSMSTVFTNRVDISPPEILMFDAKDEQSKQHLPTDDYLVKVSFQLKVGDLIDSNIMQLLPVTFAKETVDNLLNGSQEQPKEQVNEQSQPVKESNHSSAVQSQPQPENRQPNNFGEAQPQGAEVQTASFSDFQDVNLPQAEKRNLDILLDIPLQVTVELGRTKRVVKDILELSSGSIIELDKLAGEPVDIHVNNKLIAQGEVVVIDENFGVRVSNIISQSERLKNLK